MDRNPPPFLISSLCGGERETRSGPTDLLNNLAMEVDIQAFDLGFFLNPQTHGQVDRFEKNERTNRSIGNRG